MPKRKTIKVERVKELVNTFNVNSPIEQHERRAGQNALLEEILFETGNYNGYVFAVGYEPYWYQDHDAAPFVTTLNNPNYDDTRRRYL